MSEAFDDRVVVSSKSSSWEIRLDAEQGRIVLVEDRTGGELELVDLGPNAHITIGGDLVDGSLDLRSRGQATRIRLQAAGALVTVGGGQAGGRIVLLDDADRERVRLDGQTGDIVFANADFAERFDVPREEDRAPGTVLVIGAAGELEACERPYDSRLAGVVAGAGAYRPAVVMDDRGGEERPPVVMAGKAVCEVEADSAPIAAGDLLTTSAVRGRAMRASERDRAVGAILGKALAPLASGIGRIPALVTLQ